MNNQIFFKDSTYLRTKSLYKSAFRLNLYPKIVSEEAKKKKHGKDLKTSSCSEFHADNLVDEFSFSPLKKVSGGWCSASSL